MYVVALFFSIFAVLSLNAWYMLLIADVPAPVTYHWVAAVSHWTGCPGSPGTLSVTLLTTSNKPPRVFLMSIALPSLALLIVFANLIELAEALIT